MPDKYRIGRVAIAVTRLICFEELIHDIEIGASLQSRSIMEIRFLHPYLKKDKVDQINDMVTLMVVDESLI